MPIDLLFAGVPTAGYLAAVEWYERFFGRPADVLVKDDECMWRVVGEGWLYVVADAARAGNALVTVLVADLEAQLDELRSRGFEPGEIETAPGKFRRTLLLDPDGNRVAVAQPLGS
jgi:glyoxalase/bleomycin resistance protein/dioxygenase superfamily protein